MTNKRIVAGAVIVMIVIAFAAGYFPERSRRVQAEAELVALRAQHADSQSTVRAARLLGELLNVIDAVAAMNYGQAQTLSSAFFDHVRTEASASSVPAFRSLLEATLQRRDQITGAIARGDATVIDQLRTMAADLRSGLGYSATSAR